jgi:hypothetical protein
MRPPATTVAGPVLSMERSADPVTVVVSVETSLEGSVSGDAADTCAEFVIEEVVAGAATTTVMAGAVAPEEIDGRVHVTEALPEWAHDQPVPDADTNVTPGGRVSSTETLLAPDGPWFVTESV